MQFPILFELLLLVLHPLDYEPHLLGVSDLAFSIVSGDRLVE
jgi:hypothetical protein